MSRAPLPSVARLPVRLRVVGDEEVTVSGMQAADLIDILRQVTPVRVSRIDPGVPLPEAAARRPGTLLTDREREVVALVAQGLSNQAIADRLFLSINTIKSYIRASYRKIGVASRSQAVLWAVGNDLVLAGGLEGERGDEGGSRGSVTWL